MVINLNFYQPNIIRPKYPFKMRKAEIATFLSHRKCWQKIIDDELDGALIIEDDVSLSTSFFSFFMEMALQEINAGIKLIKKDTESILKNQQTIITTSSYDRI